MGNALAAPVLLSRGGTLLPASIDRTQWPANFRTKERTDGIDHGPLRGAVRSVAVSRSGVDSASDTSRAADSNRSWLAHGAVAAAVAAVAATAAPLPLGLLLAWVAEHGALLPTSFDYADDV